MHQDTEDFDFIEYTVVVKLTPDMPGEPPSQMRIVGAKRNFQYARRRAPAASSVLGSTTHRSGRIAARAYQDRLLLYQKGGGTSWRGRCGW